LHRGASATNPPCLGQRLTVPLTVEGQLTTPEAFAAIVLRAGSDGAKWCWRGPVELGAQSYAFSNRENGVAATSAAVQLSRRQRRAHRRGGA
jgi:multidrug efflux pump